MKKFIQSPWGAATVTAAFFLVIMGGVAVMAKSMIDSRFKEASKPKAKLEVSAKATQLNGQQIQTNETAKTKVGPKLSSESKLLKAQVQTDSKSVENNETKTEPNAPTNTEPHGTVPEAPHEATSAAPPNINTITIEAPAGQPHHPDVGNSNESHDAHGEESHTEHKADADHGSEDQRTDSSHAESHGNEADAISHERPTLDLRR